MLPEMDITMFCSIWLVVLLSLLPSETVEELTAFEGRFAREL